MGNGVVVRVEGLGKKYTLGSSQKNERYTALRDVVANSARNLFRRSSQPPGLDSKSTDFWALKDVSFEVKQGEVLGVIGRNGAGKSTLLKILSRITEPTEGRITIEGRVASLLEVGTGFHPELTGRENIYLNGAILGMHRHEIKAKFDEIVAFAEVEKFLDTPVKRYSSGMYVRLAFAVAAHLEPEILIFDEVLAVGDAEFQKKCLGKMQDVAKGGGRTVLLVSHNMGQLLSICSRAIWLNRGEVMVSGDANQIINRYLSDGADNNGEHTFSKPSQPTPFHFTQVTIRNAQQEIKANLDVRESFSIEIGFVTVAQLNGCEVSLRILNTHGVAIFSSNRSRFLGENIQPGEHVSRMTIPAEFLMPGDYVVTLGGFRINGEIFAVHERCLMFTVEETGSHMARYKAYASQVGVVLVHFPWSGSAG